MSPLRIIVLALVLSSSVAWAQSPGSARITALRAEIASAKEQLVAKYAELREREENGDSAGADLVRLEIEAGKKVLLPKYVELAELEQAAAAAPTPAAPAPVAAKPAPPPARAAPPAAAAPAAAAPRPAPAPPAAAAPAPVAAAVPARRSQVDPAPYDAAGKTNINLIRVSLPPKWVVLDDRRVVIWTASDEAYLLGLQQACPGLFDGTRPKLQTFSTKLKIGEGAVVAGGQACVVASIARLDVRHLPKPPRG